MVLDDQTLNDITARLFPTEGRQYDIICSGKDAAERTRQVLEPIFGDRFHINVAVPKHAGQCILRLSYKGEDIPDEQLRRAMALDISQTDASAYGAATRTTLDQRI